MLHNAVRRHVQHHVRMSLTRIAVHVDSEDLAIIKAAAAREGISEAEIIREAIHLAALSRQAWHEPLDWPSFTSNAPTATAAR
jgi:hypothetical protein